MIFFYNREALIILNDIVDAYSRRWWAIQRSYAPSCNNYAATVAAPRHCHFYIFFANHKAVCIVFILFLFDSS